MGGRTPIDGDVTSTAPRAEPSAARVPRLPAQLLRLSREAIERRTARLAVGSSPALVPPPARPPRLGSVDEAVEAPPPVDVDFDDLLDA